MYHRAHALGSCDGSYEDGYEPSGSIVGEKFDCPSVAYCQILQDSATWSEYGSL